MKKIKEITIQFINEFGWFAVAIIVAALVAFILVISEIITPVINYLIWGIE